MQHPNQGAFVNFARIIKLGRTFSAFHRMETMCIQHGIVLETTQQKLRYLDGRIDGTATRNKIKNKTMLEVHMDLRIEGCIAKLTLRSIVKPEVSISLCHLAMQDEPRRFELTASAHESDFVKMLQGEINLKFGSNLPDAEVVNAMHGMIHWFGNQR